MRGGVGRMGVGEVGGGGEARGRGETGPRLVRGTGEGAGTAAANADEVAHEIVGGAGEAGTSERGDERGRGEGGYSHPVTLAEGTAGVRGIAGEGKGVVVRGAGEVGHAVGREAGRGLEWHEESVGDIRTVTHVSPELELPQLLEGFEVRFKGSRD